MKSDRPLTNWSLWLGMLKSYLSEEFEKDEWFYVLKDVLVGFFGAGTVQEIERVGTHNSSVWGIE